MVRKVFRCRKPGRGLTIVELLTLIVVVAILAAFAIPGMSPVVLRHRLRGAAWQLTGDLRLARQRAVTVRKRFRVCVTNCVISVPAGSYSIEREDSPGLWVSDTGAVVRLPSDVTIAATTETATFKTNGMAGPTSLTVSNILGSYQLTVANTGRVRVCEGPCPP